MKRKAFSMDHPVVITFLIFTVIGFMSFAAEVLKPLALAVLLSFALAPVARLLERRLPRSVAVILTVVVALGALGAIGYIVGEQLTTLAYQLPEYRARVLAKLPTGWDFLKPTQETAMAKVSQVAGDVARSLLEILGVGSFVLILVLFMLMNRDDLSDRIVQLFGHRQVTLTTRTMEEAGHRISRYLGMFATVNSTIGLIVGVGLSAIGVPLAVLWGVLAALFRFIPYVGPATAFVLPLTFSVASSSDTSWTQPLMVIGLFAAIELLANSFLEPVIYGRTTGVSALGLLVAAMFWTWLWGPLGLLLSTPMTVCLAVLGKYVPGLGVFATLLNEEAHLEPDVRFYQRLLAMDQDGATVLVEDELKRRPRAEVFDQVLIPALSRAERDRARNDIDERELTFVWRVVGDLLDDLEETPEVDLKSLAPAAQQAPMVPDSVRVLGIAASDHADALALRMLDLLLAPSGCKLSIIESSQTPLKLAEQVAEIGPQLVVLSHLPPAGFTTARYLVRRLRARFPELPILVGRWRERESGDPNQVAEAMTTVGASHVVFLLADARSRILDRLLPKVEPQEPTKALTSAPTAATSA
ncbi:MAG TPA: AI-2E family transporter [Isosphaeraceae bacterium]|nr:AI-2E family transporter [Isosphaeraceae bacterium]